MDTFYKRAGRERGEFRLASSGAERESGAEKTGSAARTIVRVGGTAGPFLRLLGDSSGGESGLLPGDLALVKGRHAAGRGCRGRLSRGPSLQRLLVFFVPVVVAVTQVTLRVHRVSPLEVLALLALLSREGHGSALGSLLRGWALLGAGRA
eukprot:627889-Pyramimonas_sp.AAC.2